MIEITSSRGDKMRDSLNKIRHRGIFEDLDRYGREGVFALRAATPVETGLTAQSWQYRIIKGKRPGIEWYNTNAEDGVQIAILIQYGHATGTGGYVHGRDYINPAMRNVFDRIADDVWKKVTA